MYNVIPPEKIRVTVPSDKALLSFLTSLEATLIPHKVLTNEAFARKLLLGSMQRIGENSRLMPDVTSSKIDLTSLSTNSSLMENFDIRIVDNVLGVSEKDLVEAVRIIPESGNNKSEILKSIKRAPSITAVSNVNIFMNNFFVQYSIVDSSFNFSSNKFCLYTNFSFRKMLYYEKSRETLRKLRVSFY